MNVLSIIDRLPFFDSLTNLITQIGNPAKSKAHAWVYDYAPLTQEQVDAAYCGDWLPRRIVDVVPFHMTREWRTWQADQAEKLYATEKAFQVRTKIREAGTYDRLYGGGVILIGADTKYPDEPLRMEKVTQGGLKYLHVLHRWQLTEGDIVTDLESPDFGKPAWYTIRAEKGFEQLRIHRSRFAFFCSLKSPFGMSRSSALSGAGWGQSILDIVIRACIRAEAASENGAALMEKALVDVIGVPDLPAQMATKQGQERLVTRFTLANQLVNSNAMLLLGGNETFDRKQVNFGGIPELMHAHMQTAAGAAKVPVTVLLGQSPAGLNATGESDTRNFYDEIKTYLGTDLQEIIGPLDEVLIRTTLGTNPKGIEYEWNPLWQLSEAEKADNAQKKMTAVSTLGSTGLFAPEELRPAVADMIINDGFLPTLDQHMLSEGEMESLLGQQEQLQDPNLEGGKDPQADPQTDPGGTPKLKVVSGGKKDTADYGDLFDVLSNDRSIQEA